MEAGVLLADLALEVAQRRRRLDPQIGIERRAEPAVGVERLRLAAGAVEREHELAARALAQRQAAYQHRELADEVGVAPQPEVGVDPVLAAGEVQLLEVRALDAANGSENSPSAVPRQRASASRSSAAARALLASAERERRVAVAHLERTEDPELHRSRQR